MQNTKQNDYSVLDHPEICSRIFYPRPEIDRGKNQNTSVDQLIPVNDDTHIGARFHMASKDGTNCLFFHGNGEIAADYDEIGPRFCQMGMNFLVVDYRGYGRSEGHPTVTAMMNDCHTIFDYVCGLLKINGYHGPLIVMGRSLGSASAFELASAYPSRVSGLIIESGFAFTEPLLALLGIDTRIIGFQESTSFGNLFKAASFQGPILFIHAENDQIIPYSDSQILYEVSPSPNKRILMIPKADHNDILVLGWDQYFAAIEQFLTKLY